MSVATGVYYKEKTEGIACALIADKLLTAGALLADDNATRPVPEEHSQ